MPSPGDPLWEFCGFANGTSFRTKYFLDESTWTLTPCGEFAWITLQTVPLLFYVIVNYFHISSTFPRFESRKMAWIMQLRCYVCLLTVLLLFASLIMSISSAKFRLKEIILAEYGIALFVWIAYGVFWTASCLKSSWSHSKSLGWSSFFATKAFHFVTFNRLMLYGIGDARAIISLVLSIAHLGLAVLSIWDWRLRREANPPEPLNPYMPVRQKTDEEVGFFSRIFFCWTKTLIKKGADFQLNHIGDLYDLPTSLQVHNVERRFIENSPTLYSDGQHYSIYKALFHTFGKEFISLGLIRVFSDAFTFTGPILLHLLVEAFQQTEPSDDAAYLTMLTVFCTFMAAILTANFNYYTQKVGLKIRTALITGIYDRLLTVPSCELASHSGKLMNFVTTDVDRIVNFTNSFHAAWSLPLQAIIGIYLLYREIGYSALAGVLVALVIIPFNNYITKVIGRMSEKFMAAKDQRIKLTSEVVDGFRVVKMSAMEFFFEDKIAELRQKELYYLKVRKYLDAVCVYLWASTPLFMTAAIIASYTLGFHEKLTAAKIFPVLALVNILIMPLNAMPWVFTGLVESGVSLRRLQWFFRLKQMDLRDIYSHVDNDDTLLSVHQGRFAWKDTFHSVRGVNLDGKKGQIVGVTGDVGSGKTTFLLGLLGETTFAKDSLATTQNCIDHGIGYMGEERWLTRGTIKENILAGKPYNEGRYQNALKNACLLEDIKNMPGGDLYKISDNGASLSGGQRTRVALARAMYQDNDVYILDEPFASLDETVATKVFVMGIEPMKAQGKLVILATHNEKVLAQCSQVLKINRSGEIEKQGSPADVLNITDTTFSGGVEEAVEQESDSENIERVFERESDEERQRGAVSANIYMAYSRSVGHCLSLLVVICLVFMQFTKNTADWWLSRWTDNQGNFTATGLQGLLTGERQTEYMDEADEERSLYFLKIYGIIAAANTLFTLARAFLFAYGGLSAAKELHASLLHSLLKAPVTWLDKTPSGRIINRLCADVYTVDDSLPFTLNIFFASSVNLIGSIIVSLLGMPYIIVVYIVLAVIYYHIQKLYRRTTVELKRMSSLTLSPLFSHISDTVNGLVTIRAHKFTERFNYSLRNLLGDNIRAQFANLAAGQWLNVRLSMIAVAVVATISIAAIIQHRITGINSGLVALGLTYALTLTGLLNGMLSAFIETEKEMVAVERIDDYLDVETEDHGGKERFPVEIKGKVEISNISLRYDPQLPWAVEAVSFVVEPGQKIAIIGRTGAGKSTIFQALLRTVYIEIGNILIDGVNTKSLSLRCLRSIFGVIPQHPFIFSGTLLDNLTVFCKKVDINQVTTICRVANMETLLERLGGLEGIIEEGGKNLSFGERQIISICRILLSKPKIVLIDEGTSHMDQRSHERMFSLLNVHLPGATVLSIVHKPYSLEDYDTIIEMNQGGIQQVIKNERNE